MTIEIGRGCQRDKNREKLPTTCRQLAAASFDPMYVEGDKYRLEKRHQSNGYIAFCQIARILTAFFQVGNLSGSPAISLDNPL